MAAGNGAAVFVGLVEKTGEVAVDERVGGGGDYRREVLRWDDVMR